MSSEHLDVLIIGAGLSGVGAACHLRRECPSKSFAILESRERSGGTWDLFRYPGIRSDSDMFTLGYEFKPWLGAKALADGPAILAYIRETAAEHGIEQRIRYGHRVVSAEWSSGEARWTVTVERMEDAGTETLTCSFLFANTGYYRYDEGYTPAFPGVERFAGRIVHPQHWPEELDYTDKRVVVIGSGATAVTLVPAMAARAAHVTMLQRSPTYVLSLPESDPVALALRRVLPPRLAYPLLRAKNVALATALYRVCRRAPRLMRTLLQRAVARRLPAGYDVETHFKPAYDPWDQRLCFVPDADLFEAISTGSASVATGSIETFTEQGVRLTSGEELQADIVITATGLNLLVLGGIRLAVDGREVRLPETVAYKGMMLSGVPNLALTIGYTNASWTLKADLVARHVCRLLEHMDKTGMRVCTPRAPAAADESLTPFLDLASGYVLRSLGDLPKQGSRTPWRLHQNYARDLLMLRFAGVQDEALELSGPTPQTSGRTALLAA